MDILVCRYSSISYRGHRHIEYSVSTMSIIMVYKINSLYTMMRMTQLPFTTDEKLALLALLNLSGSSVVDMVSYFIKN